MIYTVRNTAFIQFRLALTCKVYLFFSVFNLRKVKRDLGISNLPGGKTTNTGTGLYYEKQTVAQATLSSRQQVGHLATGQLERKQARAAVRRLQ